MHCPYLGKDRGWEKCGTGAFDLKKWAQSSVSSLNSVGIDLSPGDIRDHQWQLPVHLSPGSPVHLTEERVRSSHLWGRGPPPVFNTEVRWEATHLCPTELRPHRPLNLASQEPIATTIQGPAYLLYSLSWGCSPPPSPVQPPLPGSSVSSF